MRFLDRPLQFGERGQRLDAVGAGNCGLGRGDFELLAIRQFQELAESRLGRVYGELRRKLGDLLLQYVGLALGQVLLGDGACLVELAVVLEFCGGELDGCVRGAEVLLCCEQVHVGVQHAFLDVPFGLLRFELGGLAGELARLYVQAAASAVP